MGKDKDAAITNGDEASTTSNRQQDRPGSSSYAGGPNADYLFGLRPEFSKIIAELNKCFHWQEPQERMTGPVDMAVLRGCLACVPENVLSKLRGFPDLKSQIAYLSSVYDPRVECLPEVAQIFLTDLLLADLEETKSKVENKLSENQHPPSLVKPLPPKKVHLEKYFNQINLTEKQREVVSLRFEHGLSEREIARRKNINLKTVQGHMKAYRKKQKAFKPTI
jgi:DNA-binding CsgD family transcriptional regulator